MRLESFLRNIEDFPFYRLYREVKRAEVSENAAKKHAELAKTQVHRGAQKEAAEKLQYLHTLLEDNGSIDDTIDAILDVINITSGSVLTPDFLPPWTPDGLKQALGKALNAQAHPTDNREGSADAKEEDGEDDNE